MFALARDLPFESINVDLIYGLPFQTPVSFQRTIDQILSLNPDRIALFSYAHVPSLKRQQKALERHLPSDVEKLACSSFRFAVSLGQDTTTLAWITSHARTIHSASRTANGPCTGIFKATRRMPIPTCPLSASARSALSVTPSPRIIGTCPRTAMMSPGGSYQYSADMFEQKTTVSVEQW